MKTKSWSFVGRALLLGFILLPASFCLRAQGENFSLSSHTIGGGGGGNSTNAQFNISGTLGQLDASPAMTNSQFSATGGFWVLPQVIQTAGAPTLYISASGGGVTVYWQDAPGWSLVQSGNLTTPVASWTASSSPTLTGGTNYVSLANAPGNLFFQLKNP